MGQLIADRIDSVRHQWHVVRCRDSISRMGRQKEIVVFVRPVNREHPIPYAILKDGQQANGSGGLRDAVSDAVCWIFGVVSLLFIDSA